MELAHRWQAMFGIVCGNAKTWTVLQKGLMLLLWNLVELVKG